MNLKKIPQEDRRILRGLAERVALHASHPIQEKKKQLWIRHNDLKIEDPLVLISPENGWNEILPSSSFLCTHETARSWERALRQTLYHAEYLKDDTVIDTVFYVPLVTSNDGYGVPIIREGGENGGAYHIKPAIEEYEDVFPLLHFPHYTVDQVASQFLYQEAQEIFDGILKVEQYHQWWWSLGLTWWYIDLRGLENFLCDFILEPEWVHRMMHLLCDGTLNWLDELEQNSLLFSNTGNHYVGSGGFGFTNELPSHPTKTTAKDMWGFVESQETSSVSPEVYGEFIFPYHKKIAQRFGLNCYGCCEAFESRWRFVSQFPNLRRVSCSPWCSREISADLLKNHYISSHKLSPTPLSYPHMDEDEVRRNLKDVLHHISGTVPELIMKDTHTLGKNPLNAIRWVEIAREEIASL